MDDRGLGSSYAYLLGLYLGDGTLARSARGVWRLRIFQDSRYTALIDACAGSISEVSGNNAATYRRDGCTEIYNFWKHWTCLFPQHGPGPKHLRRIVLEAWQRLLIERYPKEFVKGLIHSDGCRVTNTVRHSTGKSYSYPRYFFTNHSDDIRELFAWACGLIGVDSRPNNRWNISVAKRASVAILDEFVGPKS
ncbi:MAG: hypothetical protein QFC55_02875 [Chloroflexota bacterium]|nr:hypothetical protein [Chloroflexota bacterium]